MPYLELKQRFFLRFSKMVVDIFFYVTVFVASLLIEFDGLRENKEDFAVVVFAKSLLIQFDDIT